MAEVRETQEQFFRRILRSRHSYVPVQHRAALMYSGLPLAGSILRKRQPIHLTFFVTRKCNARCPFCFYLQSTAAVEPDANELSLEEIRKLSRSLGPRLWLPLFRCVTPL